VVQGRAFGIAGGQIAPGTAGGGPAATAQYVPLINRRDLGTVMRVKSGETLVLAGIITKGESAEERLQQAGQELKPPPPPARPGLKEPWRDRLRPRPSPPRSGAGTCSA